MTADRAPIPPEVRREVLKRAGNCCEDCFCGPPEVRLEMHHLRYQVGLHRYSHPKMALDHAGDPIFGQETPDDLAALCRDCHHNRHLDPDGEFWVDPEAMEDAWFGCHWAMDKDD